MYEYDRGGNITARKAYAYSTGELGAELGATVYTYDSVWKDKLATYGGVAIQSDALGNVTSDGYWSFIWEGGRRLSGMSGGGQNVAFKYDENGHNIRQDLIQSRRIFYCAKSLEIKSLRYLFRKYV